MAGGKGNGLTVGEADEARCTEPEEPANDAEGADEGEQQTSRGQEE